MKARVKATGEVVEVFWSEQYEDWHDRKTNGHYSGNVLEFLDTDSTDWQAYRMEVAKECAAHLLSTNNPEGGWEEHEIALMSVDMADALIARLKEQKGE